MPRQDPFLSNFTKLPLLIYALRFLGFYFIRLSNIRMAS